MSRITLTQQHGDIRIFYQWVNDEASMILAANRLGRRKAWVIGQSVAHQYADSETGAPTAYLIEAAVKIAEHLGFHPDRSTVFRIASAIVDDLPELIKMPPPPAQTAQHIERLAERDGLVLRIGDQTVVDAR